jgi:hypothetical protein
VGPSLARSPGVHRGAAVKIRRIRTPTANVRVDLDNERHVAWLMCRHVRGEQQTQLGRQLGYTKGSVLCVLFEAFTKRHCPEAVKTVRPIPDFPQYVRSSLPYQDRKHWFEIACRRFYAAGGS